MELEKKQSEIESNNNTEKNTVSAVAPDYTSPQPAEYRENLHQEEDVVLDLTAVTKKAKTLFTKLSGEKDKKSSSHKNNPAAVEKKQEEKEEFVNLASAVQLAKKYQRWLIPLLCIFLAIIISTSLRMTTSSLPITEVWATNQVHFFYSQQLEAQINQQYPHLPLQNREALVQKEIQKFMQENKKNIDQDIASLSQEFKSQFSDANGDTYLLAIDPYLWFSEARNVVNHGHLGDKKIDGQSYFTLRDGRLDKKSSFQLHPYIAAYFFKVLSFLNPNISLMRALFLLPVFLIGVALIPAFFIGRKFAGTIGGLFAALFLVINAPLLSRTVAGFADTDSYSVLFPLFISWFFLEAYTAKTTTKRWLLSLLAGFMVGVYAAAWTGWSAVFLFLLGALVIAVVIYFIQEITTHKKLYLNLVRKEKITKMLHLLAAFFISSALFVSIFDSFRTFYRGFGRPLRFIASKEVSLTKVWPNVLTTVAEFNTNPLSTILSQMGGTLLFWLALLGMIFLLTTTTKKKMVNLWYAAGSAFYYLIVLYGKEYLNNPITFVIALSIPIIIGLIKIVYFQEEVEIVYPLLLLIWLTATAYAYTKGMRFALLMAPAFAIALGTSLGILWTKASRWLHQGIHLEMKLSQALILAVLCLLLISPFSEAKTVAENEFPTFNDGWYNALTKIKVDAEQAIITSWWDFGHWFVAIAERMVTFDGGDQGKRIYWVGKTLLSDSEAEAVGILRMLNCGQEMAVNKMDTFTGDNLKSLDILQKIIPLADKRAAEQEYIKQGLTAAQATEMLQYTHCDDIIPHYLITSQDLVSKAGVWGHFGSWDFEKATQYQQTVDLPRAEAVDYLTTTFGMTIDKAEETSLEIKTTPADDWIAPWPNYVSLPQRCEKGIGNTFRCKGSVDGGEFTVLVNMDTHDAYSETDSTVKPDSLVYAMPDNVVEKELDGKKLSLSLVLIPSGDNYQALFTDPLQAMSLFTRLFFLEGHGLHCFQKFDDLQQVTGERILTWKVDYDCEQENKVYFTPKEVNTSKVANKSLEI